MPTINGVQETCLYVDDLTLAIEFYEHVLGFRILVRQEDRFCAFSVADKQVLLLFKRGATLEPLTLPGGVIPPHNGSGPEHVGFAISQEELEPWRERLAKMGVPILSTMKWPLGGTSIYFEDPDKHVVELLTPGVWAIY